VPLYTETSDKKNLTSRRNYLYLTSVIAITDFKMKYDNSAPGYLWSLLKTLLMFGTLYPVFSVFVGWNVENYKLYLLSGIILWTVLLSLINISFQRNRAYTWLSFCS